MGLEVRSEVFLRQDLAAILKAITLTMSASSNGNSPHDAAYRKGFADAIGAIATAVHVEPHELLPGRLGWAVALEVNTRAEMT